MAYFNELCATQKKDSAIMKLKDEIIKLINSKREGNYWDFKEEPHENKASLLHDIICLSNSLHKGNKYLIFGVTDPNNGASVKGLLPNQNHRKSQVQYIDFIRTKPFAGDCRPELELHTLSIEDKEIDVLVIFDNPLKPFYLTEQYTDRVNGTKQKTVKANHIYTRTNDTNTPIDKSADVGIIEKMWKQRFGLDLSPIERMKSLLLKPDEWFKDIGNKPYAYHLEFPEFNMEFSEVSEFWEVFSYFFTNEKSYLGTATFKYHSTTLFELEYMYCDEMRIELSVPKTQYIELNKSRNWYYYFDLSELNGTFLYFMTNGLTDLHSRGSGFPFIIFKNKQQRISFNTYLSKNEQLLNEINADFHGQYAKESMDKANKSSVIDPIFIDKIVQLHDNWAAPNTRSYNIGG
ncbi:MAG: hypothetical protein COC06_11375 [Bacteroidales bacterium]|nr:MAG: hypothetical protein COC06_11375 [Bacteroidales bacterium]